MSQNYTLKIFAGADYYLELRLKSEADEYILFDGCSARMKLKKAYDSATELLSLTSDANGGLSFEKWDEDAEFNDTLVIHITAAQTATMVDYSVLDSSDEVEYGEGVYDLEIVDSDGVVVQAIRGVWVAAPEATK